MFTKKMNSKEIASEEIQEIIFKKTMDLQKMYLNMVVISITMARDKYCMVRTNPHSILTKDFLTRTFQAQWQVLRKHFLLTMVDIFKITLHLALATTIAILLEETI